MTTDQIHLDVIIPVFNEAQCLPELMRRLEVIRDAFAPRNVRILFVNDGSTDATPALLLTYAAAHPYVSVINFSRNFGHQMAVTAGLDHSDADYTAIIDADLQDPPELLGAMLEKLISSRVEIVYGKRIRRDGETLFKRFSAALFYRMLTRLCRMEIPRDTGDFRVMSRLAVQGVSLMREQHRFIRGMVPWTGFPSVPFEYQRQERLAGTTKYPLRKMLHFALDAILSFSNTPLRLASYCGLFIIALSLMGGLFLVYLRIFTEFTVPGITATILTIVLMGGMQILMLGIIGEYIGRIFEASKGRPLYLIQSALNVKPAGTTHEGTQPLQ